jgi:hypothetical protein
MIKLLFSLIQLMSQKIAIKISVLLRSQKVLQEVSQEIADKEKLDA